jgi:hypothetical protein
VVSRSAIQMPGETEKNYEKPQCPRFEYQSKAARFVTLILTVWLGVVACQSHIFLQQQETSFCEMFNYAVSQKFLVLCIISEFHKQCCIEVISYRLT